MEEKERELVALRNVTQQQIAQMQEQQRAAKAQIAQMQQQQQAAKAQIARVQAQNKQLRSYRKRDRMMAVTAAVVVVVIAMANLLYFVNAKKSSAK